MHPFPHRYHVESTANPHDEVILESPGLPPLTTATPPEFDGPGGRWSPETLLVAAVADCYLLTFRGIAKASSLPWISVSTQVTGTLERPDRVSQFTRFDIRVTLILDPDVSEERARRILTRAEETCLITRSLNGEVQLDIEIIRAGRERGAGAAAAAVALGSA
ncbi:MAG TPA: OsmC family protein [Vicinamibacterales bacterium]|nr:OsmC family protein [Vicinamibacterales bacterium]